MNLSFVGDIMLGRFVREKRINKEYNLFSDELLSFVKQSDYVIANLESPITDIESTNSLAFAGDARLLKQCSWIDCFSISNNHINDFGEEGITDTIKNLQIMGLLSNGVYSSFGEYTPLLIDKCSSKIAVVTCTDMLNYEFKEGCPYQVLRVDSPQLNNIIKKYDSLGFFVIVFAHCGSLFSRFPNPQIREILHSYVDAGAKCVVTSHSHCLGGMYIYNNVPVFYSLGDFLMDGASYRRRRACILTLSINDNELNSWDIKPTITNTDLITEFPSDKKSNKMLKSLAKVSRRMQQADNYKTFYNWQYKKEMLYHSLSALHFLYDTKGFKGLMKMLKVRSYDVCTMFSRMIKGRSNMRYDSDAVDTKLTNSDIK